MAGWGGRVLCCVEPVRSGLPVELGDHVSGGCQHQGVQPLRAVGLPGREHVLGVGRDVADVDSLVVEVEPEGLGSTVAQRKGGGALGGVGESDQLRERQSAVLGADVA